MTSYSKLRFTLPVAVMLLITALIASSSVHALGLGNVAAQSALGQPLRVVIPITAGAGETIDSSCFKAIAASSASDLTPQVLTAGVSVERDTAEARLIVSSTQSIDDPVIRLTLQSGCEAANRHEYLLLFDPPANRHAPAPVVALAQVTAQPAPTVQHNMQSTANLAAAVKVAAPAASPPIAAAATADRVGSRRLAPAAIEPSAGFYQIAAAVEAAPKIAPMIKTTAEASTEISWGQSWLYLAAALGGTGILMLIMLAIRLWRAADEPAWIGGLNTSPSSVTHVGAKPVTLPNFHAMSGFPVPAAFSKPSTGMEPDTTLVDSLLGEIDDDLIEERAVREAWAAARREVESDAASNSILRAIEDAERHMHLSALPRAQAANDHIVDDALLKTPKQPH